MPQDYEVTRQVWEGRIPVEFVLSTDERIVSEKPKPFYALIPLISYLPVVSEKACKYLLTFVDNSTVDEVWFDYEGIPLKWHYPVGVLFDVHKMGDSLPWQLTVHFTNFPERELFRLGAGGLAAVEAHFIQTVKEADQLKHKIRVVDQLNKRDHKQLWNGLINDRFDQFWQINRKLMENPFCTDPIKCIPFRLYRPDKPYIQRLMRPWISDGDASPSDNGERRATTGDLLRACGIDAVDWNCTRLVAHGVDVPLDCPLLWLAENLAYPDNFVHLSLVPCEQ